MNNSNDIFEAISNNDIERVEFLIESSQDYINTRNEEGQTPLIFAATEGREEILIFLLNSGSDIDKTDEDGDTALMNVARNGSRENIIEILLNRGADINLQNNNGYSAFMLAVRFNPSNVINTLETFLNVGADIHLRDVEGNTALQLAIMDEKEDLIIFLIEKGSDIESQNNVGDTPLIIATYSGYFEIVKTLLTQGADPDLQNYELQTPLHVALEYEHDEISERLAIITELDIKDREGRTPLFYACKWGVIQVFRILLERGADPYITDNYGNNAFYAAGLNGNSEIIRILQYYRNDNSEISVSNTEEEEEDEEEEEEDEDFEEATDIDETNFTFDTCRDLMLDDNVNIVAHLNETDTFLFINGNPAEIGVSILCFDKNTIRQFLVNKNDNWFYECNGPFLTEINPVTGERIITNDRTMSSIVNFPYIKIFLNEEGLTGFVPLNQIRKLLSSSYKVYYIYPMLENGTQKMISHTVSWQNAFGPAENRNFVNANHCQSGSNILIYTLKVCRDPERCVRSIFV